jgi:succinate-acetate transporter protein
METDPVSETLCSLVLEYRTMDKSKTLVIPSVVHHGQHPLESKWTAIFYGGCTLLIHEYSHCMDNNMKLNKWKSQSSRWFTSMSVLVLKNTNSVISAWIRWSTALCLTILRWNVITLHTTHHTIQTTVSLASLLIVTFFTSIILC